jgi:DNA modification methylase
MEIKETDNEGLFDPYSLDWDDTIKFPSTRKLKQYGNRIYNRYPARSIFLVPRATILCNKNINQKLNVLDPFMGSGTTAVEAVNLNCQIYGTEMDPFARLIAEVSVLKFSILEKKELLEKYNEIFENWKNQKPLKKYYPDLKNVEYWFDDLTFNDLLKLKSHIYENITNEKYLKFFKVTFADCIKPSSKMERQSTKPYISSKYAKKIKSVDVSFEYSFKAHLNALSQKNCSSNDLQEIKWAGFDATNFNTIDNKIHLAITSPPYLSAFDYTQIIKIESSWVGTLVNSDIEQLRRKQVGHQKRREQEIDKTVEEIFDPFFKKLLDNPKKSSKTSNINTAKNCLAYFNDIYKNLKSVKKSLIDQGEYHMIIGDNVINGIEIPTHKIIAEIAQKIGFNWSGYYKYQIKDHRTSIPRNGSGGKIKYEYVIILKNDI